MGGPTRFGTSTSIFFQPGPVRRMKPPPMLHDVTVTDIDSWQAAEAFAATYIRAGGHPDARTTGSGADAGVDIKGARVLAQVKHHRAPVGRPDLQRLFGARGRGVEELYFFSLNGYSPPAIQYAKQHGIGLLSYTVQRDVTAHTSEARS